MRRIVGGVVGFLFGAGVGGLIFGPLGSLIGAVVGIIIGVIIAGKSFMRQVIVRRIVGGVIGLLVGSGIGLIFGSLWSNIGAVVGIIIGVIIAGFIADSGESSSNPVGLCNSCLSIQLSGMTIRGLINDDEVFNSLDGKSVLIFHLFDKNGCYSCKEKAKDHLQAFVNRHDIGFDVEKFYNGCRDK